MVTGDWVLLAITLGIVVVCAWELVSGLWGTEDKDQDWGGRTYYSMGTTKGYDWRSRLRGIQREREPSQSHIAERGKDAEP